ncbi:hypothetical protein QE152_g26501 [Popillia japonica]|uniref:Uncharacterized protein n=1 Tax=Popillia japonica TaxID=7064 RepID=A0AAW1JZC7_POPJA
MVQEISNVSFGREKAIKIPFYISCYMSTAICSVNADKETCLYRSQPLLFFVKANNTEEFNLKSIKAVQNARVRFSNMTEEFNLKSIKAVQNARVRFSNMLRRNHIKKESIPFKRNMCFAGKTHSFGTYSLTVGNINTRDCHPQLETSIQEIAIHNLYDQRLKKIL